MSYGQTDLMKAVPHCRLLESVATMPLLIWHQSGAGQPPPWPTWPGLGLTWPPQSVDTHGDTYINKFPIYVP
jgi:hypothetical protein